MHTLFANSFGQGAPEICRFGFARRRFRRFTMCCVVVSFLPNVLFFKVFYIAFTHESVCGLSAAISRKVCAAIHNRNKWPATYPICGNMWHGHIFGAPFVERNQPTASVCQFQCAFCTTTAAPHKHPLRFGFVSSKGVFS